MSRLPIGQGEQLLKRVQAITMNVYQYVGDGVLRAQIYERTGADPGP